MDQSFIDKIQNIPQPKLEEMGFMADLKKPLEVVFKKDSSKAGFLANGVRLEVLYPKAEQEVETAFTSLKRVFAAKEIPLSDFGAYPVRIKKDAWLAHEEYAVTVTEQVAEITAGDADGLRRAIYFLEDRLCEKEGFDAACGSWKRKPFVKNRISRCFFGPTYRPPFYVDELLNDIDYYPEEYLNKLAHEGINGVWLSMYFRDFPSTIFPTHGKNWEKRLAKLKLTVQRCKRYGIRIFVYVSEPKSFGTNHWNVPIEEAEGHPEVIGSADKRLAHGNVARFCTSNPTAQQYLRDSITALFTAVPDLGGMINIIFGEDNGGCATMKMYDWTCDCPVCSQRSVGDIYREIANTMAGAMHAINPEAEMIEWFYAPGSRDGSKLAANIVEATKDWPKDCSLMLNFESGGISEQLGKGRNVFDYSLAYLGPSQLFREVASHAARPAAKLQVGCSHEDASVPFIPVPSNLYEKYKAMNELNVSSVMQCWYFGNYPGLMNKAAGELSFRPFPQSEDAFLQELAAPLWREHAPVAVEAWKHFAAGYRSFPANIGFAWYGPMHHSIAWPLYLFPVDGGISPSWLLKNFPEVSGDRVGETLIYQHTLAEGITLCNQMREEWQKGVEKLASLETAVSHISDRVADIILAKAILLQIKATCDFLQFYSLREDMLYNKHDNLATMKKIVLDEIANSREMITLCKRDSRLGYHSEAEGYLFFPEKLEARIQELEELLAHDFPRFCLDDEWILEYTGEKLTGKAALCPYQAIGPEQTIDDTDVTWESWHDDTSLFLRIHNITDSTKIEIEPCRMWPPVRVTIAADGRSLQHHAFIHRQPPEIPITKEGDASTVQFPLSLFDGYHRDGFPMRINLSFGSHSWAPGEPWPSRLLHENFNPARAGWLIL